MTTSINTIYASHINELRQIEGSIAYCNEAINRGTQAWEKKEYAEVIKSYEERKAILQSLINDVTIWN